MTATLKKALRDRLGTPVDHLTAAAVEFASGKAVLLLTDEASADGANVPVHVRKVGGNRFEIELETEDDEELDEVTAAFLRLKRDQFEKGKLRLSEPVTADGWGVAMDEKITAAEAALERSGTKSTAD